MSAEESVRKTVRGAYVQKPDDEPTECTYPGCPFEASHYHVEDADGERVVFMRSVECIYGTARVR